MEDMAYQRLGTCWQGFGTSRGISARNRGYKRDYDYKPEGICAKATGWTGSRESKLFRGFLQIYQDTKTR
jgi:hypothetical protein